MGLPAASTGTLRLPNQWIPRPYQWAAWKYLSNGGRHAELLWHRRGGKDELALHHTACSAWSRVGNYWHMLPMAEQARKAMWNAVNPHTGKRRIDEAFPHEMRAGYNDHEMLIRFKNGSAWQVVGSDNFNSLVGSPPIGLVFSEWPLCDPASWAYLMPIMEENGGWAIFNGTPRGRNHAFRSLRAAQMRMDAGRDAFAQVLDATQTGVFSAEQLERIKQQLIETYGHEFGLSIYEQEYLCSFDAANLGAILGRYVTEAEREGRVSEEWQVDPEGAPIEISSDIGFRDTAAWWFWQPRRDGFALVAYDGDSGLDASQWIDRLTQRITELGGGKIKLGKIWLPHDARAKTFSTQHSPMEQFLKSFGEDVVRVVPQTKKLDQINAARSVMPMCRFAKSACKEGLEGLAAWSYVYDAEKKDFGKDPKHDWACFTPETEVLTRYGTCQIMNLPQNGEVLTPCGWKEYQGPRRTRLNAQLVEVVFSDGHTVRCTPDHLFLTDSGWKSAESLTPGSSIQSSLTLSRNISMAVSTAYGRARNTLLGAVRSYIDVFGNLHSGVCLTGATSIIGTQMQQTTYSQIWNAYQQPHTFLENGTVTTSTEASPIQLWHAQQSGTNQKPASCGTNGTVSALRNGSSGQESTSRALSAGLFSKLLTAAVQRLRSFAPTFAESLTIESVSPLEERVDTWCIHVPDGEWFSLANGAVVHNSHPGDSFAYGALIMREREAAKPAPKTEAERIRTIKGITVDYPGMNLDANGHYAFPKPTLEEMWKENARPSARI